MVHWGSVLVTFISDWWVIFMTGYLHWCSMCVTTYIPVLRVIVSVVMAIFSSPLGGITAMMIVVVHMMQMTGTMAKTTTNHPWTKSPCTIYREKGNLSILENSSAVV
jgi:hypothetical protein